MEVLEEKRIPPVGLGYCYFNKKRRVFHFYFTSIAHALLSKSIPNIFQSNFLFAQPGTTFNVPHTQRKFLSRRIVDCTETEVFSRKRLGNLARTYRGRISHRITLLTHLYTYGMRSGYESAIIYARYRVSRSFAVDRGDCDRDRGHAIGIRKRSDPPISPRFAIGFIDHSVPLFGDCRFSDGIYFCISCLMI